MLLVELVRTCEAVGATRSRTEKVQHLAATFRRLDPEETVAAVGFISGQLRQGRFGVGWATLAHEVPPASDATLTVADLDQAIDEIAAMTGSGSVERRRSRLADLMSRATQPEQDFIRGVLLGDLRMGALAGIVTDAVAKAAEVPLATVRRAAMLGGELPRVAAIALADGKAGLEEVGLTVGGFVQPMLAATATGVTDALAATGEASVEWKLDGARVQVHRDGDDIVVWTRNGNDITDRLPGIVAVARALPVRSVVLDGEAIWLGEEDERPEVFQDLMSRFGRQDGEAGAPLLVRFFDVLHHDGEDLVDRPLRERAEVLDRVGGEWVIPRIRTDDDKEASAFLEDALARGHEGVMVKDLESLYEAGRRGGSWRKVKPVKTLDLVVLAAEWGHGRRRGWLSNLHLGARDSEDPTKFVMVGKTFKGLTDRLLTWQTEQFLARKTDEEGIVVHVRPELVVEIALDGVQRSTRYPGGVALRFARVRGYRDDKSPADADTIDAVRALLP